MTLYYEAIPGPVAATRRAIFLHGLLGRGSNLRTLARRFLQTRPGWDAWLVDLRGHGASPKGGADPSLAAAADDVLALCRDGLPIGALIGHSFGGKVALQMAPGVSGRVAADAHSGKPFLHVVTLDSNPGTRVTMEGPDSALSVIELLEKLPATFASRAAFIDELVRHRRSRALAQWLAMSTETGPDGSVHFALALPELRALLYSYLAADLWPLVEAPPEPLRVHLVIGARSRSYAEADRNRARAAAAASPHVSVDFLDTDHWVHSEDLEGLLRILDQRVAA
jgi:pimeloyl-ACP methyl ester carboxylesterase